MYSERDKKLYTGCTQNLSNRVKEYHDGKVFSTQYRQPSKLVYYEAFINKKDAYQREKWFKTGWGRNQLRKILSNYFENLGG